jgi:hypothetical protein
VPFVLCTIYIRFTFGLYTDIKDFILFYRIRLTIVRILILAIPMCVYIV